MILSNQSFSWLDLIPNHWEIDKVKDHLKVELQKIKEKMRRQDRKVIRNQKEYRVEEF